MNVIKNFRKDFNPFLGRGSKTLTIKLANQIKSLMNKRIFEKIRNLNKKPYGLRFLPLKSSTDLFEISFAISILRLRNNTRANSNNAVVKKTSDIAR